MSRKPRATNAPVASAPMTAAKAQEIRALKERYPAMSQHEIGRLTGTNQGRVSEVLAGKRT
jgi:predicted transcriptional regulator